MQSQRWSEQNLHRRDPPSRRQLEERLANAALRLDEKVAPSIDAFREALQAEGLSETAIRRQVMEVYQEVVQHFEDDYIRRHGYPAPNYGSARLNLWNVESELYNYYEDEIEGEYSGEDEEAEWASTDGDELFEWRSTDEDEEVEWTNTLEEDGSEVELDVETEDEDEDDIASDDDYEDDDVYESD